MNVLYFLERSTREIEPFIRREIAEVMRQGSLVAAACRSGDEYRIERADVIMALDPASALAPHPGEPLPPAAAVVAMAEAAAMSPRGALRASTHARRGGRGLGSGFRQAVALARHARRVKADIFHAHFAARACEDAMLASWISGIPFTFTAHGYDVHLEPPSDYAVRGESALAVVTVSEDNARVLTERHGIPRERLRVIPLGVDTERFKMRGDEEPGLIVSVLRLHPDKGPDLLLDAAADLLARGVEFRLEIHGDGEERAALSKRLDGPLGARVKLMGSGDERAILSALRRAALFVLPSRRESLGVALMEAMACSRAVVASSVGGVPEVTDGGRCAVLVPPGDTVAMADAIEALLADPARRADLGRRARERIVATFRLDESVLKLRRLWVDAAPGGPGAGAVARGTS